MTERKASLFIVVEGIDGVGKSTFSKELYKALKEQGHDCLLTFEPTKEKFGKKLRRSFTSPNRLSPSEELALFVKDRMHHLEKVIIPVLNQGRIVISDRYYYSTAAYQGARGLDPDKILADSRQNALNPDLCFLLCLEPEEAVKRITQGRCEDTNNFEELDYLKKVAAIYDKMEGPEIVRLDARRPVMALVNEAKELIDQRL